MSDNEKTPEQRVRDAIAFAQNDHRLDNLTCGTVEGVVRDILEAADAPPKPKWPTDESGAELGYKPGADLSQLREAMLADPIMKAAIAMRDAGPSSCPDRSAERVVDAVNEAGL